MPFTVLAATDNNLVEVMGELVDKPLAYAYFNYPWGEPGPLEREVGPDTWQIEVLQQIEEALHAPGDEGDACSLDYWVVYVNEGKSSN